MQKVLVHNDKVKNGFDLRRLDKLYDVIVAGGGPIGLRVAQKCAAAGLDVAVLEEHRSIGTPMQCAGLVSPRVVKMTDTNSIVLKASMATIHPPNGDPLVLNAGDYRAAVLDRKKFDREMAQRAVDDGVEINLGCKVESSTLDGDHRSVRYEESGVSKNLDTKILIAADGPTSTLRRDGGYGGPKILLAGVQALVGKDSEEVHIFLGKDIAPGFFAWQVPHPQGTLVGLASDDGRALEHLNKLLTRKGWKNKVISIYGGTIPLGRPDSTIDDKLMFVGDAACQVKPLSGGGLYTGLISADLCSSTAIKAIDEEDTSRKNLKSYQDAWQKMIGKEISKGLWMRKIYRKLTDEQLDELVRILRKEGVKRILEEKGDIDYPSTLAKPVFKAAPELLKFTGPFIKGLF